MKIDFLGEKVDPLILRGKQIHLLLLPKWCLTWKVEPSLKNSGTGSGGGAKGSNILQDNIIKNLKIIITKGGGWVLDRIIYDIFMKSHTYLP